MFVTSNALILSPLEKTCTKCRATKSLDDFYDRARYKYGKDSVCKDCTNLYQEATRRKKGAKARPNFLERIWNNLQYCEHGDDCPYCCWPWRRRCTEGGYGVITIKINHGQIGVPVTHVIYELWHARPVPTGKIIAHHCDNPPCGNPVHIWPATYKENMEDAVRKGRMPTGLRNGKYTKPEATPRGDTHGKTKLPHGDVMKIRTLHAQGMSGSQLSKMFHVSQAHISRIVLKRTRSDI